MTPEGSLRPSKALDGVHGVHLLPHSPFVIQEIKQHGDFNLSSSYVPSNTGHNRRLTVQKIWQQRPPCLKPIHCSLNGISSRSHIHHKKIIFLLRFLGIYDCLWLLAGDRSVAETVANVLTSLPFIALGILAPRKNLNCKIYANSLIGVGVASSLYHASRGKVRKYLRWADYTMIATATVCLSRAIRNDNSRFLMGASAFFLPLQPLMVSAVHTGLMEVSFAKRASKDRDLQMAHNVHKMSSILGGALFIADDLFPETPFLHAGWHLAAAVGVGTCNKLL